MLMLVQKLSMTLFVNVKMAQSTEKLNMLMDLWKNYHWSKDYGNKTS